jgi:DNA-binding CsgD family transcriptional regulator
VTEPTVVVGVDGAGRTHRLGELTAAATTAVVRVDVGTPAADLKAGLASTRADGVLVVVDDAHRLEPDTLRALTDAARRGVPMVVARRPTISGADLAALDEAVAARGRVEQLAPLTADRMAALVSTVTGKKASAEVVEAMMAASAGLPAIAAAAAAAPPGTVSPALTARVQRLLATLDPTAAALARILALRLDLADDVLAAAAGADATEVAPAMRVLRDGGLLAPDGERMIPALADALLADLPPAERRRVHDAVARALLDAGADPIVAATQLRAARAGTPLAAQAYRAAGDRLCFTDPAAAAGWYDDAAEAGADPVDLAAGRAESAALLGLPATVDDEGATAADAVRLRLVDGAVAAHQGRAARAADVLLAAGGPGPVLAVPALVTSGRADEATVASGNGSAGAPAAPQTLRHLATAALALTDPAVAVPLFIEAAEAVERHPPTVVLPDTPHALGAVVAVAAGDAASAEHLLRRAMAAEVGGPVSAERHRLLLAWVHLRTGRYDTAVAEVRRLADAQLPGRERLLLAARAAGVARRSGDIGRLRDTWAGVEQTLARRAVDLSQLEAVEELLVAAARLRQQRRAAPVLATLTEAVAGLGRPPAWAVALGWTALQVAIAAEDTGAAEAAAAELDAVAAGAVLGERQRAQCAAARVWARTLADDIDPDEADRAATDLAAAELPWEASRLAGQAAIRTDDPQAARRLLERARDLGPSAEAAAPATGADAVLSGLSEREVEVARLVLAGRTYREIGAQLYISPKTVEHHVARIRTKVGATTRAEFVAALRDLLTD